PSPHHPLHTFPTRRSSDLHVVHLVGPGVIEILALEIDFGAAEMLAHALGEIQRARPADVMFEMGVHLRLERGIGLGVRVGLLQLDRKSTRLNSSHVAISYA